jgi:hypothetical protein
MQRMVVIARLRPGAADRAAELIELGPPFDPSAHGVERHTVFLADDEAVFVFEGGEPGALLATLAGSDEQTAIGAWAPLLDGVPKLAREVYTWRRRDHDGWKGDWGE